MTGLQTREQMLAGLVRHAGLDEKARSAAIRAANEIAINGAPVPEYVDGIIRTYIAALPSSPVSDLVERLQSWDHCWPAPGLETAVAEAASTLTSLSTKNAELEREVKRLREALSGCFCPRPVNAREYGFTVGECVAAGECGCCDGETLRSLSTSPQGGEHGQL